MTQSVSIVEHPCELHSRHTTPSPLTVEFHHIVPVAWQLFVPYPATPFSPGNDPDGRGLLWDTRGMWLCPTSHRNVHSWITTLMRELAAQDSDNPITAMKAIKHRRSQTAEFNVACLALTRFEGELPPESASLLALTAAGEWGQS
jgi:hypothetical protein